jgi:uncharacterized protein YqeY
MKITDTVDESLKQAMREKDQVKLRTLRSVKSAFLLAASEKSADRKLTDEAALKVLQKLVKQRKDSLAVYESQNRDDLARKEQEEIEIIESFLPEQLDEAELTRIIQDIIHETGATEPKDMGKVMGVATKKLAGKADNKAIAAIAKKLLG